MTAISKAVRYADLAYPHTQGRQDDPKRQGELDRRARAAGFSDTRDYIHDVMGRPDTKHMEGGGGRVRWANQSERISGMNNPTSLKDTTVFPDRRPQNGLANFIDREKGRKDLSKEALREKGPLSEQQRTVNPKLIERQALTDLLHFFVLPPFLIQITLSTPVLTIE